MDRGQMLSQRWTPELAAFHAEGRGCSAPPTADTSCRPGRCQVCCPARIPAPTALADAGHLCRPPCLRLPPKVPVTTVGRDFLVWRLAVEGGRDWGFPAI